MIGRVASTNGRGIWGSHEARQCLSVASGHRTAGANRTFTSLRVGHRGVASSGTSGIAVASILRGGCLGSSRFLLSHKTCNDFGQQPSYKRRSNANKEAPYFSCVPHAPFRTNDCAFNLIGNGVGLCIQRAVI